LTFLDYLLDWENWCKDAPHLKEMGEMQELMQSSEEIKKWFDTKRIEFNNLPKNE
jgi:hypothetical protein